LITRIAARWIVNEPEPARRKALWLSWMVAPEVQHHWTEDLLSDIYALGLEDAGRHFVEAVEELLAFALSGNDGKVVPTFWRISEAGDLLGVGDLVRVHQRWSATQSNVAARLVPAWERWAEVGLAPMTAPRLLRLLAAPACTTHRVRFLSLLAKDPEAWCHPRDQRAEDALVDFLAIVWEQDRDHLAAQEMHSTFERLLALLTGRQHATAMRLAAIAGRA
jgi:hypothetical protein